MEPKGLVISLSPVVAGVVMNEKGKREITAVAVVKDGSVFAAGVGTKQASTSAAPAPSPLPPPAPSAPSASASAPHVPPSPPPSMGSTGSATISGGSDLYRIHTDGYPERVWSHSHDIIYSIGF